MFDLDLVAPSQDGIRFIIFSLRILGVGRNRLNCWCFFKNDKIILYFSKEKEKELDVRNIYANRILKSSPKKEIENTPKRKGISDC